MSEKLRNRREQQVKIIVNRIILTGGTIIWDIVCDYNYRINANNVPQQTYNRNVMNYLTGKPEREHTGSRQCRNKSTTNILVSYNTNTRFSLQLN